MQEICQQQQACGLQLLDCSKRLYVTEGTHVAGQCSRSIGVVWRVVGCFTAQPAALFLLISSGSMASKEKRPTNGFTEQKHASGRK